MVHSMRYPEAQRHALRLVKRFLRDSATQAYLVDNLHNYLDSRIRTLTQEIKEIADHYEELRMLADMGTP